MKGTPSTDVSSVTAAPSVVSLPVVTEDIQPEVNTGVGSASTNDAILPTPGVDQLVEWLGGHTEYGYGSRGECSKFSVYV